MHIEMFIAPDQDPRAERPLIGDERATLVGFLRWQRETLDLKCQGLQPDDLARRAVEPSTLTLLGLIRHMAEVERWWFRRVMAGEEAPPYFRTKASPDAAFADVAPDPRLVGEAFQAWRDEVAFAERLVEAAPNLDVVGEDRRRGAISLRWVLVHMVEEYARHNGHADLLRERIDGRVGQ